VSDPVDLVIFDCDGVLVDSERLAVRIDLVVLRELGWALTEDQVIERFVGRSHESMVTQIEAYLGCRLPEDWEERFQHLYRDAFDAELRPVDGVLDALSRITIPTCIASSGSHDKLRYTLGLTGLYEQFEGRIFSAEDVRNGKPAPDLFLHAADQMGVSPELCVVVEDSRWGLQAARAAGMRSFGFAGSVTTAEILQGPHTVVFTDMRELPDLIEQL
jgi:HAD superfamily hydrolase (TIGR01509 family)